MGKTKVLALTYGQSAKLGGEKDHRASEHRVTWVARCGTDWSDSGATVTRLLEWALELSLQLCSVDKKMGKGNSKEGRRELRANNL